MPPTAKVTNLMQTLIDGEFCLVQIPTTTTKESDVNPDIVSVFNHARPIGISPGYSATGKLAALAIADDQNCRIIEFNTGSSRRDGYGRGYARPPIQRNQEGLQLLEEKILCRDAGEIFAFDMGPLAMSLYCDAKLRITHAVDIQSGVSAVDRKPLTAIMEIVGTTVPVMKDNVATIFRNPIYDQDDRNRATDLAQRAWVSQFLAGYGNGEQTFEKVPRIDTKKLTPQNLDMIAKVANDSLRLDQLKPTQNKHQATVSFDANGQTIIQSAAYKDRIRPDRNIRMEVHGSGGKYIQRGQVGGVRGRTGALATNRPLEDKTVSTTLISIGRDDPTTAEAQRASTVLRILQGSSKLLEESPWIKNIWFPNDDELLSWPKEWSSPPQALSQAVHSRAPARRRPAAPPERSLVRHSLNSSQQEAVNTMYSTLDMHRITIIQGPPGTGKTSVIATFVQFATEDGSDGIWLVAQSNVAVKNIAEKLMDVGLLDWKLIVSTDFHFQWHEHIYEKIQDNVVRSVDLFSRSNKLFKGCKVVLCTLSMLSNSQIHKVTLHVPIKTLVVDEASQIEIGDYIPVFSGFHHTLRKVCFIGDDKQLPPYGQEDLQDLQSIFEISHLRKLALFLNTQYRMPPQIGQIISDAVYDELLKSNPLHPISDDIISCQFVDVPGNERPSGDSFMNQLECNIVLKLAQHLQDQQREYQIITPYEGQRSTIEEEMKAIPGLVWENKCFNVDAFQGNEKDYIIISIVRSRELGFLKNLRRTNVMLTRCKKGMFVVSSQKFLTGVGSSTLVGTLMEKMGPEAWLEVKDIEEGNLWKTK